MLTLLENDDIIKIFIKSTMNNQKGCNYYEFANIIDIKDNPSKLINQIMFEISQNFSNDLQNCEEAKSEIRSKRDHLVFTIVTFLYVYLYL